MIRTHRVGNGGRLVGFLAVAAWMCTSVSAAEPTTEAQPAAKAPRVDELGDPLPSAALMRLGAQRFHAPSTVVELALSPDEKTVVSFGDELIAWDTATGKERWRAIGRDFGVDLVAAAYGVRALAFTPDGRQFYTPGDGNNIIAWDTLSGERQVIPIEAANVLAGALVAPNSGRRGYRAIDVARDGAALALGSASGLVVASGSDGKAYQIANRPEKSLDINSGDRLQFGGHYSYARFSPDGKSLALVTSDTPQAIRIVDVADGTEKRRIELSAWLVRMDFTPDGQRIVATERDSAVRVYDVATTKPVWSRVIALNDPHENYTCAVAVSPDGTLVAVCATDELIYLLDAADGHQVGVLRGSTWRPWSLAFTSDGKTLYSSGWDGAIRRWDVAAHKQLPLPQGRWGSSVIAASPDGRTLAYQDGWGAVHQVDAETGAEIRSFELAGTRFGELAFSPDGQQLAAGGGKDGKLKVVVWEIATGKLLHEWNWPRGKDPKSTITSLAYSPSGNRLAVSVFRQSAAYLWNLTTGKQVAELPHQQIYGLSFVSDDELVTAGWDRAVRFWNARDGKVDQAIDLPPAFPNDRELRMYTVCASPEQGLIATAHLQGMVRVWQSDNMALRTQFQVNGRFIDGAITFSPDGLWLATGGMDGSIAIWDVATGQSVWSRGRHQGYAYQVAFGAEGRTLLTGGDDSVAYLWDLRPEVAAESETIDQLWDAIDGNDGPAAYRAMWALADRRAEAVDLLAEKLRGVTEIVDPDWVTENYPVEDELRFDELKRRLADGDPKLRKSSTFRRAVWVLASISTPEAVASLEELAATGPASDVGRIAAAAVRRAGMRARPSVPR